MASDGKRYKVNPYPEGTTFQKDYDKTFKIILLGQTGVGKSAFVDALAGKKFTTSTKATISVNFHKIDVMVDGHLCALHIWDTAGQERFGATTSQYCRDVHGIIFCYDTTDSFSFENVKKWVRFAEKVVGDTVENPDPMAPKTVNPDPLTPKMLLGSKKDLRSWSFTSGSGPTEISMGEKKPGSVGFAMPSSQTPCKMVYTRVPFAPEIGATAAPGSEPVPTAQGEKYAEETGFSTFAEISAKETATEVLEDLMGDFAVVLFDRAKKNPKKQAERKQGAFIVKYNRPPPVEEKTPCCTIL
jgi:GTPase SAR1 family protein